MIPTSTESRGPEPRDPRATVPDRDDPASGGVIATGDRQDEIHFEPDPDQLFVVRHEVRPRGPLPPQDPNGAAAASADAPPVEDVRILPEEPSVWDARPLEADEESADH
ncbi:hypothetical protein LJR225_002076 [Phenylobacterium sp. LjRoot225]|uniref:hypothetical protein n=1 Tax=Phenylobacterium sp. LjRoot225 TaxID=3342285 RepID=UPI003ECD8BDF